MNNMLAGIFHEGSGLGDQLFRYITVRTLAEEKGFDWWMRYSENFKGEDFFQDFIYSSVSTLKGLDSKLEPQWNLYKAFNEKDVRDTQGNDIRSYDPEINFIEDNTIIDGSFEDSRYWGHNISNVSKWLAVEPLEIDNTVSVVGFRGGEYYSDPNLGLPTEYFAEAMTRIPAVDKFQVHTDDPFKARETFKGNIFEIVDNEKISHSKHSNMGFNWRSMRYAKYAIISNSSFFILPRLLKHFEDPTAITIAPRYWAGRNQKIWKRPACYYEPFTYV